MHTQAGHVPFWVYRDPRGASARAYCKAKGFGAAGAVRSSPLASLSRGVPALNLATREQCDQPECHAYVGIECVPEGATKCRPDLQGNVGVNNVGSQNFGSGNRGNLNIGGHISRGRGGACGRAGLEGEGGRATVAHAVQGWVARGEAVEQ